MRNYLVKIYPKQWSDKLLDGSVFMRSVHDFGTWSLTNPSKTDTSGLKPGVQGDAGEGIIFRVNPQKSDDYFNRFSPTVRAMMQDQSYIDEGYIQYLKGYCMYILEYNPVEKCFIKPDSQLREFGDSAVIILNEDAFGQRLLQRLTQIYANQFEYASSKIFYYPQDYYGPLNEFCKRESYKWQNEFRVCIRIYDKRNMLVRDVKPITADIGSIRDIAIQIPVEDLIALKLPEVICPQK